MQFSFDFDTSIDEVFGFLTDHPRLAEIWGGAFERIVDAPGDDPNGLGAVRRIRNSGLTLEETVTAFEKPTRMEYRITKGSPLKNHHGVMLFSATAPDRTHLDYTIEFEPKIPLTGGLLKWRLEGELAAGLDKLARRYAGREA